MANVDPFYIVLHHISSNLSRQELEDMKFFCKTKIGKRKLSEIERGIDLFSCLMQQHLLSATNTTFLTSMLQSLKREDLLQELDSFVENGSGSGEQLNPKLAEQLETTFQILCDHVGREWKQLVRRLGVSQVVIDRIIEAYPRDMKEQFYQSLLVWKKSKDKEVSVSTIEKALRECKMNLTADILAEKLEEMHL